MYLKEFEDKILNELTLKGIFEITKVTFTKYDDDEFDPLTGGIKKYPTYTKEEEKRVPPELLMKK